jgi:transposase
MRGSHSKLAIATARTRCRRLRPRLHAVEEFVRQVRPAVPAAPVIRFETAAGRQAQVDFARFRFPWGVRHALLIVLGYSRLLWCRFYPRQDMRTLIGGLEEAFGYLGGVPQELLFDQMKVVITRDCGWRAAR